MATLWIRDVRLMIIGREYSSANFTITFRVPFSTSAEPDVAEVSVYNLSEDSTARIKEGGPIILKAGYKDDIGAILSGRIDSALTRWDGPDKITTLAVSDGGIEWRNAEVNRTYQAGATASYIMQDLAGILGLEIADISPAADVAYPLGRTISGSVDKALKGLVEDTSSKMYIYKDRLYIRPENTGTETGFILSADTGLIGSPELFLEEGRALYKVRALLNHRIGADSLLRIQSKTARGLFRVVSGEHSSDFVSELIVAPTEVM